MNLTPSERAAADEALNYAFVVLDHLTAIAKTPLPDGAAADVWEDLLGMNVIDDEQIDPTMDDVFALLSRVADLLRLAGLEFPPFPDGRSADDIANVGDAFDQLIPQ